MNAFRLFRPPGAIRILVVAVLAPGLAADEVVVEPFESRSQPEGSALFTELPTERTGVVTTNDYDDPRMWGGRHSVYTVGAIGTGVAIGDYDGDGKPDIFIASKVESGRLFRNLGDWRFEDVTASAGLEDNSGEWKQGVAFADVDNDGWLDLYVCRFDAPNQLFMNQGDGTFRDEAAARGLDLVDASGMAAFADYDRDGWLDVYIQTNLKDAVASIEGQPDYLFRNNGDGTFADVTAAAGILPRPTQGHSATWWDQDDDGWLDLYVANDFAPPDFLYRNHGDGTFSNVIDLALPHTPFSSMGADLGDVDNDGRIDFFVADMAGSTWEFTQRGLADSRAQMPSSYNDQLDTAIQLHYNALYLNTGTSRSLEAANLAGLQGTDWTWSTRFEDLDNDGWLDLHVTNGMDREHNNLDFIVRKLSAVNVMNRIRLTKSMPVLRQANLAFANRGDLRFEEVGAAWGLDKLGVSFGVAFGDLDGDGDLDIVHTNYQEGATLLRNDSQSGNSLIVALRGVDSNRFGVGARVTAITSSRRQTRQLIPARGYLSTSEPALHFGLGDEERVQRLEIVWPSGRLQALDDLASGHRYTVTEGGAGAAEAVDATDEASPMFEEVAAAVGLARAQREEELEGTVLQPLLPRRFNRRGPGIAVGDLDGDGVDEILLAGTAVDGPKAWVKEAERYQALSLGPAGQPPPINHGPPLIFDANGDGRNDLLLTGGGAALPAEEPEYEPSLWLGDGAGGFAPPPEGMLPALPISVGAAVAADFDRDGSLDLFLGGRLFPGYYPEPPTSALLLQREGQFEDLTDRLAPDLREVGLVTSALASDVDGDGWIDLVLALEWGGVRFFRNHQGRSLEDVSEEWGFDEAGSGLWTSLAAADFNGDGRLDYALGNLGLNTQFQASPERPLRLYAYDFAGSGEPQLVLAVHREGALRPVASRAELGGRIPAALARFPSNDAYAAATLEEILGQEGLAQAELYEVQELRSGVLLSQATGGYAFSPLPRLAQIAPIQGMVAGDFDGDGRSDLLFVNNDYSPIPAHGRFDSGLGFLLLGDGSGGFHPVPPAESGWLVPGDAKALCLVDLDGDARPDAIVSRNGQTSLAFRNAAATDGRPLALRLQGRVGNRAAIGARVTLEKSEGEVLQLAEIRAGEGWASQSTSSVFLTLPEEATEDIHLAIRWPSGERVVLPLPAQGGYLLLEE